MPPPSGRKYKGISVPFFFQEKSADAFRSMSMKSDDIILSSCVGKGRNDVGAQDLTFLAARV